MLYLWPQLKHAHQPLSCLFGSDTSHACCSVAAWLQIHAKSTPSHRWLVVLDAAAYVPTHPLDLSAAKPDFVPVSWYKVFGAPTGGCCQWQWAGHLMAQTGLGAHVGMFGASWTRRPRVTRRSVPRSVSAAPCLSRHPPGLGALIARKESLLLLRKYYFGGGSVVESTGRPPHTCTCCCNSAPEA